MPPILDFSSAFPWLGAGLIAGLLLSWLVRLLLGTDRRRDAELNQARAVLNGSRQKVAELSGKAASLESEWARLTTEVGQLQPRAALVPQFERQLAETQQASVARQGQLDDALKELAVLRENGASEIASLRHDLDTHSGTAKYYEGEFNRLFGEHDTINRNALSLSNELQRTKASLESASRDASEAVRLKSDLASAKADVASLRTEAEQRKGGDTANSDALARVTADYDSKLKYAVAQSADRDAKIKDLTAQAAASEKLSAEVAQLKSQLASVPQKVDSSADVAKLRDELASANSALSMSRSAEQAATAAKQSFETDFQQVRKSLGESSLLAAQRHDEIAQLKAQLAAKPADAENFRRFKDALDAANRIAAGLPEKI